MGFSYKLKGRKFAYVNVPDVIWGGGGGQCEAYFYLETGSKKFYYSPLSK